MLTMEIVGNLSNKIISIPEIKTLCANVDVCLQELNNVEEAAKEIAQLKRDKAALELKVNSQPPEATAQRLLKEAKLEIGKLKGLLEVSEEQKRTDGLKTFMLFNRPKGQKI